ncbi:MAG: hypothetical protein JWN37_671 [Candidatus Nomurabacteria bacterium]|nr:hypothetical protein [Candidatus Nomurabacteria bacterium]
MKLEDHSGNPFIARNEHEGPPDLINRYEQHLSELESKLVGFELDMKDKNSPYQHKMLITGLFLEKLGRMKEDLEGATNAEEELAHVNGLIKKVKQISAGVIN